MQARNERTSRTISSPVLAIIGNTFFIASMSPNTFWTFSIRFSCLHTYKWPSYPSDTSCGDLYTSNLCTHSSTLLSVSLLINQSNFACSTFPFSTLNVWWTLKWISIYSTATHLEQDLISLSQSSSSLTISLCMRPRSSCRHLMSSSSCSSRSFSERFSSRDDILHNNCCHCTTFIHPSLVKSTQ